MDLSSEAKKEVQRLLAGGEKLRAVQYLHETFRISLLDAKTLVEVAEAEERSKQIASDLASPTSGTALEGDLKLEVVRLLKENQKLEAIKLVRSRLGTPLKVTLDMVEEVQKELDPDFVPSQIGGGCLRGTVNALSLIFGFIAALLMSISGLIYYFQVQEIEASRLLTGTVTGFDYSGSSGSAPVVSYEWDGETRQYHSHTYSTPPAYSLNEAVEIYVNPNRPGEVIINTFTDRWLVISILGGIGSLFLLFALAILFIGSRFKSSTI